MPLRHQASVWQGKGVWSLAALAQALQTRRQLDQEEQPGPTCYGSLAHPWLPQQDWVGLGAPGENLNDPQHLGASPKHLQRTNTQMLLQYSCRQQDAERRRTVPPSSRQISHLSELLPQIQPVGSRQIASCEEIPCGLKAGSISLSLPGHSTAQGFMLPLPS